MKMRCNVDTCHFDKKILNNLFDKATKLLSAPARYALVSKLLPMKLSKTIIA